MGGHLTVWRDKVATMRRLALLLFLTSTACASADPEPAQSLGTTRQALDLTDDPDNCGAEGYICKNGRSCVDSACFPAWQPIETTGAPSGRFAAAAIDFQGQYVITGGCTDTETAPASAEAYAYNPATDSWAQLADLNYGRAYHSASNVVYGTFVYGGLITCNDTSSADRGFEGLTDLGDSSWLTVNRNWTPGYNVISVRADTDDVVMMGGGETDPTNLEVREGSPYWYGSWSEQHCRIGAGYGAAFDYCGRSHPIAFFDFDIENRPTVRVLGGDPTYGTADLYSVTFDIWSHRWIEQVNDYAHPSYAETVHSTATTTLSDIPVGPRLADDGRRVYVMDVNGSVHIFDRNHETWTTDAPTVPSGLCPEGALAWVDGELIQYSGVCEGTVGSAGFRYQPPAPQEPALPEVE